MSRVRTTEHVCAVHAPGTVGCYLRHYCGCHDCRAAHSAYEHQRWIRRRAATGEPRGHAGPVDTDEVVFLLDNGSTVAEAASALGVAVKTLYNHVRRAGRDDLIRKCLDELAEQRRARANV